MSYQLSGLRAVEAEESDAPPAKRMEPKDFAYGPMHPSILQPQVILGGVDGTKISKEECPVKLTANEFLEKMAKPVGGQVTTDNSHSSQTRKSHGFEGPVSKVHPHGAKKGDPNGEDKDIPPARVQNLSAKAKTRTPDNEGPCHPGHKPMTNMKSASPVQAFFSGVLEKLSMGGNGPAPGMEAGSAACPSEPPVPVPSKVLGRLKLAAGDIGALQGSTAGQEGALGAQVVKAPKVPEVK